MQDAGGSQRSQAPPEDSTLQQARIKRTIWPGPKAAAPAPAHLAGRDGIRGLQDVIETDAALHLAVHGWGRGRVALAQWSGLG